MVAYGTGNLFFEFPKHSGVPFPYGSERLYFTPDIIRTVGSISSANTKAAAKVNTATVTVANEDAIRMYHRVGFQTIRKFSAYAWDGF